jgi:CheY-like chemotaxis protein
MGIGGSLAVATSHVELADPRAPEEPPAGDYVAICVRDNGSGMRDEVRQKAFEPFFTTKEIGKGSGLGLSQVLGFAKQSGGGVRIDSRPGRGTSVYVYLPRTRTRPAETGELRLVARADGALNGANILLVDDDSDVREVTSAMLRNLGHRVFEAGSGGAALDVLRREPNIDLMLVDFAMPGMSGAEVARRARSTRPSLVTLFITGFADRAALAGVGENRIIGKPFRHEDLAQKIRAALTESEAAQRAASADPALASD